MLWSVVMGPGVGGGGGMDAGIKKKWIRTSTSGRRERENFKTFSNLDWPELGGWECRLVVEGLPSILKA